MRRPSPLLKPASLAELTPNTTGLATILFDSEQQNETAREPTPFNQSQSNVSITWASSLGASFRITPSRPPLPALRAGNTVMREAELQTALNLV